MKVHILVESHLEYGQIIAVYANEENAEEAMRKLGNGTEYSIEEFELMDA